MGNSDQACNNTVFLVGFMPAMVQISRRITGKEDDMEAYKYQSQAVPRETSQSALNLNENKIMNIESRIVEISTESLQR